MSERRIIEINGVKMDIDLREAVVIETITIGTPVRVLVKNYSSWKVCSGVVIGFDQFKNLPTITIAYIEVEYSDGNVKFLHYNSESKDVEVIRADDDSLIAFDANDAIIALDKKIEKAEREFKDAVMKKEYFISTIHKAWTPPHKETFKENGCRLYCNLPF